MLPEPPDDHDQRFKILIREFFPEFMELFFEKWAKRFDFSTVEWLEGEEFADPPEGTRHHADLVAKLKCVEEIPGYGTNLLALAHIEVESADSATSIRSRMVNYYHLLRTRYKLPVLPIVLFLNVGFDGLGADSVSESFFEFEAIRFNYLYVGLPALDGEPYIHGTNPLGYALASLMKLPRERLRELTQEAILKIYASQLTEQQKFLLDECHDNYSMLSDSELSEIGSIIPEQPARPTMGKLQRRWTRLERAAFQQERDEGKLEGERLAARKIVNLLLTAQFQTIPPDASAILDGYDVEKLTELVLAIPKATSLAELGLLPTNS